MLALLHAHPYWSTFIAFLCLAVLFCLWVDWISSHTFEILLEIAVIVMIGIELVDAGNQSYILDNLNRSAQTTADTLDKVRKAQDASLGTLQDTLSTLQQTNHSLSKQTALLTSAQSNLQAELELAERQDKERNRHPVLEVRAIVQTRPDGGVETLLLKANSSDQLPTMMLTQDFGGISGDFIIRNVGTQTAEGVEVTTIHPQAITVDCIEYPLRLPGARHSHNEPCAVIQGPQTILPRPPNRPKLFPSERYPGPDYDSQYDLLTRVRVKHIDIDSGKFILILKIHLTNPLQEDTYEVTCLAP